MSNSLVASFLTQKLKAIEEEEASVAAALSQNGGKITKPRNIADLPSLIDANTSSSTASESRDVIGNHRSRGASSGRDSSSASSYSSQCGEGRHNISMTSSSTATTKEPTMDVHVCNSGSCKICNQTSSEGVRFVPTQSIDGGAVGVLHYLLNVASWGTGFDNHQDDERSVNSFYSKSLKARLRKKSTKYVSGDNDD
jgi:hypothetical protein